MASKKGTPPAPSPEQNYASQYYKQLAPLSAQKANLAGGMLAKMPQYQEINFGSPDVQRINQTLDDLTARDSRDLYGQDFNTAARNRDFGSSYQASRQAKLQGLLSNQYAQNKLQALNLGQSMQDSNINQALKLGQYYENIPQPAYPTQQHQLQMNSMNAGGNGGGSSNSAMNGMLAAGTGAAVTAAMPSVISGLAGAGSALLAFL